MALPEQFVRVLQGRGQATSTVELQLPIRNSPLCSRLLFDAGIDPRIDNKYGSKFGAAGIRDIGIGLASHAIATVAGVWSDDLERPMTVNEVQTLLTGLGTSSDRQVGRIVTQTLDDQRNTVSPVNVILSHHHYDAVAGIAAMAADKAVFHSTEPTLRMLEAWEDEQDSAETRFTEEVHYKKDKIKNKYPRTPRRFNIVPADGRWHRLHPDAADPKICMVETSHSIGSALTIIHCDPTGMDTAYTGDISGLEGNLPKGVRPDFLFFDASGAGEYRTLPDTSKLPEIFSRQISNSGEANTIVALGKRRLDSLQFLAEVAKANKSQLAIPYKMLFYLAAFPEMGLQPEDVLAYIPALRTRKFVPGDYEIPFRSLLFNEDGTLKKNILAIKDFAPLLSQDKIVTVVNTPEELQSLGIANPNIANRTAPHFGLVSNRFIYAGYPLSYRDRWDWKNRLDLLNIPAKQATFLEVSDHAGRDKLKSMLVQLAPRFAIPVHCKEIKPANILLEGLGIRFPETIVQGATYIMVAGANGYRDLKLKPY